LNDEALNGYKWPPGTSSSEQDWILQVIGNPSPQKLQRASWDAISSEVDGNDDAPYDTRTHNTVNEITALDPQGGGGIAFGIAFLAQQIRARASGRAQVAKDGDKGGQSDSAGHGSGDEV